MKAICATDLSAASEATIESETCLECLGRIGVDEIHLVTVIPSNVHAGMPGMDFEDRREQALSRYRHVIEDAGFDVDAHVVRGTPHRRINGVAEAIGASLTVVGSRGTSPLENRVIGSTARNLARTTVVPLLVNRIERGGEDPDVVRERLFRRMLYATDFSENAEQAFDVGSLVHSPIERSVLCLSRPSKLIAARTGVGRIRMRSNSSNGIVPSRIVVRNCEPQSSYPTIGQSSCFDNDLRPDRPLSIAPYTQNHYIH
ncbi:universal stress protein [Halostagnicola sp. A56]|uniref:universal stress protein n=1 Tax=Halostagnicola sp. A56 TaxID=1495067 RepID=UPI0009E18DAC|nr:universal stress protein [Halostagnicola sp. A56]